MSDDEIVLSVTGLRKTYTPRASLVSRLQKRPPAAHVAVDDVSFELKRAEVIGIAGESGSGKSTTVKCIARLVEPDQGEIILLGQDFRSLRGRRLREARARVQMVFQDPRSSLNPRRTVGAALAEVGRVHRSAGAEDSRKFVENLLDLVRLPASYAQRLPRDLSGGQRQRVAIARALASAPSVLLADEAVSALDVSVQTEVVNLLLDLRDDLGLAVVFVSHQLPVLASLADSLIVMRGGKVVEQGSVRQVIESPRHEYTRELLNAHPHARVPR